MALDDLKSRQEAAAQKARQSEQFRATAVALLQQLQINGLPDIKRRISESLDVSEVRHNWTKRYGDDLLEVENVASIRLSTATSVSLNFD